MASGHDAPLGFEGLVSSEDEQQKGKEGEYTIEFNMTDTAGGEQGKRDTSEEVGLLEPKNLEDITDSEERERLKKAKEQTVFFDDNVHRIDFVLTYQDELEGKKAKDDTDYKKDRRRQKRESFIANCEKMGLLFEHQDCKDSPDLKTYYYKVHGTHTALLKGAEDMLLRMPIQENNLRQFSFRQRFFKGIGLNDPFEPRVPHHLKRTSYFSAPFSYEKRDSFLNSDDEKKFFTTAQRSAIVHFIMLNVRYGEEEDQVGLLRLLRNKSFLAGYPLHESSEKLQEGQTEKDMTDRQFLYHNWSTPRNWYKRQPLDQVRRYFGEKVGIYFTWLGFYTTWLLPAAIVGIIITLIGFFTVNQAIPRETCDTDLRYDFYMCPPCAVRCDFWYLYESCNFSRVGRLFDNGATVFFAAFMSLWAVFFLEFWKRRQFFLQYDWDVLGYEDTEQKARPEFEQKIKQEIRKCKTEKEKDKFRYRNPVLDKMEYVQPSYWFYPKIVTTLSILISMIIVVLAVVFAVIIYRLAIGALIYGVVSGTSLGPAVGSIVVSITGAVIQLVAILILNKVYEFLAAWLTDWELHRLQTDYDDNFISKMFLFQFFNFYTSLFYIAFIKGNATGNPGNYSLIGNLRIDECPAYGCLLELTIQLGIIMVGKQALNNFQEVLLPYLKRFYNWFYNWWKNREDEDDTAIYARWEKDKDLVPVNPRGLFFEYLELIIQYGFTTLFVAAFPLAPFFALINNYFEIRIDAQKFVVVQRRTLAERAGDIGAWYGILALISYLAIVLNALIIAFTAQIVPISVYQYGDRPDGVSGLSGYVNWSLSPFTVSKLIPGEGFPPFDGHELQVFNGTERITRMSTVSNQQSDVLYLPYVDFACLSNAAESQGVTLDLAANVSALGIPDELLDSNGYYMTMTKDSYDSQVGNNGSIGMHVLNITGGRVIATGPCFRDFVTCDYRGYARDGGFVNGTNESITNFGRTYWQVLCARLGFIVLFEHAIVVVVNIIAFLIPDEPQTVKNERRREKLLAYEAVRSRHSDSEATSPEPPAGAPDPVTTTSI